MIKSACLVLLMLILPTVSAADLICDYAKTAAAQKAIRKTDWTSAALPNKSTYWAQHMMALGRANIPTATSEKDLQDKYHFKRYVVVVGKQVYHALNLSLGDNPYVYVFDYDTRRLVFEVKDSSVYRDGALCAVDAAVFGYGHLFGDF